MNKSELKTERLRLAALRPQDGPALIAILTDPSVTETYMVPPLETAEERERLFQRIRQLSEDPERFVYGIFLNDTAIGLLNETDRSGGEIELGYAIDPAHQGRGYASEALSAALNALLDMGFSSVKTGAFIENKASIRVMEKCGMQRTAETDTVNYRGKEHTCCYYAAKNEESGMKRETPLADVSLVPMTPEMYHAYFREFENDPELYADKSRWEHYVYFPEKVDSYIERQKEKHRLSFAIMEGSELAGEIVIKDITDRESASFGVCMKNDGFKNRGLGTQAEKLALDFIFYDLDIPTVYADALLKNKRSRRVLEKLGFESLSEDENFVYYRKDREEKTAEPGSSLSREEV